MESTLKYLSELLNVQATANPVVRKDMDKLPMFLNELYKLYHLEIFETEVLLAVPKTEDGLSVLQTERHMQQLEGILNKTAVVVLDNIQAYQRKRLIEKRINFIVPGKQMFLPDLLMDFREYELKTRTAKKMASLLPSAQFLVIYQILGNRMKWQLENHSFKEIANQLGYTPMTISNAIDNLKKLGLVDVIGDKVKSIRFQYDRKALWEKAKNDNLFVNPVIRTVYTDDLPKDLPLLKSNTAALPSFSNLNSGRQQYYAIEKDVFYALQKSHALKDANPVEGTYALEVWKYKPMNLLSDADVIDPLSLYLSVKDSRDERIEMALDQIQKTYVW